MLVFLEGKGAVVANTLDSLKALIDLPPESLQGLAAAVRLDISQF